MAGYALSHHEDLFSEPHCFDPERFAAGGEGLRHEKLLLEFGFGTFACPGKRTVLTCVGAIKSVLS